MRQNRKDLSDKTSGSTGFVLPLKICNGIQNRNQLFYVAETQATARAFPDGVPWPFVFVPEVVEACVPEVVPHEAGTTGCGPVWTGLG